MLVLLVRVPRSEILPGSSGTPSSPHFLAGPRMDSIFSIVSFLLIDIEHSFTVDKALAGALGTVTLLFRLVGGLSAGTAADRFGRKSLLVLSILWLSLFSLLSGFSTSYAMLFAVRALFGIGMGGVWAAGVALT
jgi:MFS transporter, SHS family, lactate transporter